MLNQYQRFMLPPPHRVLEVGFFTWSNFTALVSALGTTAEVTFSGLAISIVLGVGTALLMSQAKWVENALYPWAVVLQTVPILALTPFLSFFFGFSLTSRIIVAVIIAFFPIVSNTLFGLQSADRGMHDLFTLHKAGRWTRLWKLQLPAALPAMFAGFRVSAGPCRDRRDRRRVLLQAGSARPRHEHVGLHLADRRRAAVGVSAYRERARHRRLRLLRLAVAPRGGPLVPARTPLTAPAPVPSAPHLPHALSFPSRVASAPALPPASQHAKHRPPAALTMLEDT